ncbi:hypothetical protein [Neobacillus soli]|uniref:hypothetical protein n=1 Tax=Neobacillus soli TaxID=220688 RepID=UPI0008266E6F|nr:hypothetical protein [Neobacillus soli]
MLLRAVRIIQWLIGGILFGFGIYLIFWIQEFFGTLAIIAAFFIFPSLEQKCGTELTPENSDSNSHNPRDSEISSWSGDSDGGSVQKDRQQG